MVDHSYRINFYINSDKKIMATVIYDCASKKDWSTDNIFIETTNMREIFQGVSQKTFHVNSLNLQQKQEIYDTINERRYYITKSNEIIIHALNHY